VRAIAAEATRPAVQAAPRALVSREKPADEIKMVTKTVSGEISARGPNGIALVYEKDDVKRSSKEMWFPYEGEVKLIGYKEKMDIGEGDSVTVTYDEAENSSKRTLTGIRLLKKKPPEEEIPEGEEEEAEAEESGGS
jgi:hypothetical protein